MSLGKYTSLEEARKAKKLDRFAASNPSEADQKRLDKLFTAMTGDKPKMPPEGEET